MYPEHTGLSYRKEMMVIMMTKLMMMRQWHKCRGENILRKTPLFGLAAWTA